MNSEELLIRAAEERHAIVEKYRKGRHGDADIPAWEEPSYDVYHQLDRYGFIQDEKNQEVVSMKEIELTEQRVKKWIKMFHHWERLSGDKLRKRVFKGVPDKCRSTAWMLLLNVGTYQANQTSHKEQSVADLSKLEDINQKFMERRIKYEEMRELAWKYSPDIRQIDLDVNRTYREHIMFRDRYSSKQQELFNVLAAYSVYNMEIGYCQGMSQIVALLLMYLDEVQTFWALSTLVSDTKYSMHGFFIPGFPKLLRFQDHHDKIMNKFLPKLKKHLDKNNVDTGIYTLKWFFQCFLDRIPFKLTLRVWDIYLLEGEGIMSAMAYNLLKMHQRPLMKLSMDDILHFIQVKLEKQFQYTEDATIESLQKCLEELKRYKLYYAGKPSPAELPKTPLGIFKPDSFTASFEQKVGRRTSELSSVEKETQETVISRRDTAVRLASLPDRNSSIGTDASKYLPDRESDSESSTDFPSQHNHRNVDNEYSINGRNIAREHRTRNSFNEPRSRYLSCEHSRYSSSFRSNFRNSDHERDSRNSAQFSTDKDSAYGDFPKEKQDGNCLRSSMQFLANLECDEPNRISRVSTSDYFPSEKNSGSECSVDNLSDGTPSVTELSTSACTDTSRTTTVDKGSNKSLDNVFNTVDKSLDRNTGLKHHSVVKNSEVGKHTQLGNFSQTYPFHQFKNFTNESSYSDKNETVQYSTDVFVTNTGTFYSNEHFVRHYSNPANTTLSHRIPRNSKYKKNTRKSEEFSKKERNVDEAKKPTTLLITHL